MLFYQHFCPLKGEWDKKSGEKVTKIVNIKDRRLFQSVQPQGKIGFLIMLVLYTIMINNSTIPVII